MGKRLDAFFPRRRFKTSKLKATASLAISRLAVLKNQRQARSSIARSDVVEFLNSNNHDRALLRVEQVIKEQNMLDVFVMLEGYCHLFIERIHLFEHEKGCPEDLVEAVSSVIYAATRCGEFPELQELRAIFTSRFGKEFAARATELRNNCGVNPKIIQRLSTRMPSLENKMKVLREIASDNNIHLPPEPEVTTMESKKQKPGPSSPAREDRIDPDDDDEIVRGPVMRKYKDAADAAQAAFESAAYAAAAARAAVVLSRSESTDPPPDTPSVRTRKDEHMESEIKFEKIHPVLRKNEGGGSLLKRSLSGSSSEEEIRQRNVAFDESDDDKKNEIGVEMEKKVSEGGVEPLNISRRPISVRTRWAQGR